MNLAEFEITQLDAGYGFDPLTIAVSSGIRSAINSISDAQKIEVRQIVNEKFPYLKEDITQLFFDVHEKNNKKFKLIKLALDTMDLAEHTPSFIRRKQAKLDYRKIGQSYKIDQLVILDVKNYIELDGVSKNIIFKITPLVIDMEDNSFVYVSNFKHQFRIIRKWREPPHYPVLMKAIKKNITAVFKEIENKY